MKKILVLILCLIALTACSPRQIVKTEFVPARVPELPADPDYWPVVWYGIDGGYCFDTENAKNMLKNFEVLKANRDELKNILLELKKQPNGRD